MALYFNLFIHLTLFLEIILSQSNFLESVPVNYNSSGSRPRCVQAERKALLQFKANLTDPSGRLSSWVGEDCCGWMGVGCNNHTGNVIKLDLGTDNYNETLTGKLSRSLLALSHLNYLNLSRNHFEGMLPGFIGSLEKLNYLDLAGTRIHGMVPRQLGNLTSLRYLDLSYTSLWASDLDWLSGLTSLEYLNLDDIDLRKASTSSLKAISLLPSLSELHMSYCKIKYPIAFHSLSIENFTSLSVVDLSGNAIILEMPPWMFNITTLTSLDLSGCNIIGPLSHLPWHNLRNLEVLNLEFNSISDDIGTFIDALTKSRNNNSLQRLYLSSNHFSGQLGESLGWLKSLTFLSLDHNSILGEIPMSICSSPGLFWIDLSDNTFYGGLPLSLKNCTGLQLLNLWGNRLSGNIPRWLGEISNLGLLSLRMNKLTGGIPQELCHLPNLHALDLSHNNFSGTIPACFGSFSRMIVSAKYNDLIMQTQTMEFFVKGRATIFAESLYLVNLIDLSNNNLTGEIPKEIGNLLALGTLNFSRNHLSGSIPEEIRGLRQLEFLDLSHNRLSGLIPASMASLTSLNFLDLSFNNLSGPIPLWSNMIYF